MPYPQGWEDVATCECGFHLQGYTGRAAEALSPVCPACGSEDKWNKITSRYLSDSVWFKPWTWGTGHWEDKT